MNRYNKYIFCCCTAIILYGVKSRKNIYIFLITSYFLRKVPEALVSNNNILYFNCYCTTKVLFIEYKLLFVKDIFFLIVYNFSL